jgi:transposase
MQDELFAMALGVQKPWYVRRVEFDKDKGELNIKVDFAKGSEFEYVNEETGVIGKYKAYDTVEKTWRHMNFFQYRCYLHARIPRVNIGDGKVRQVKTPWEGISSGFTLLFEALILQLARAMTVHQICELIDSYDGKIWKMLDIYTEMCRDLSDFSGVESVGIDETAARRGHDYVTLFVDLKEKKTLFVTEGRSSETVEAFAHDLERHNSKAENIEKVSCDMSPAFIKGVEENLPNADITFDKFHIVKTINEAVESVRKLEQASNPILKNSRFVFLKNRKNFTARQREKYEEIKMSKMKIKTFKALQIRESFQELYQSSSKEDFEMYLRQWYFWATHSRIPQIAQVARTIKRHWEGIVNWASSRINNGILEGFNSVFQAAKAKARGYKNSRTIKTVIYLLTGKLDFSLLNQHSATHSFL